MADARLFQALSDPTRLKIMSLLAGGPMNVSGMVARLGCTQPAVSRHLRVLRDVALIRDKRKGKEVEYSVNLAQLGDAAGYLEGLVDAVGAAAAEAPTTKTRPAVRRSGVEGRQPAGRETAGSVAGWAQQARTRPRAKTEAGAAVRVEAASRVRVKAKVGAEAGDEPGRRARSKAEVGTRRAAASGKAAKAGKTGGSTKTGAARPEPKPKLKPRPVPGAKPESKPRPKPKPGPRPKPKPTPPDEPEYVIEREDDTMDDFLL